MGDQEQKPENKDESGAQQKTRRKRPPKKERLMSSTGLTIFVMINGFIVVSWTFKSF